MKVKIITTIEEAKALEFGEQYIIQPKGMDLQKPEDIHKHLDKIASIQEAVEKSIEDKQANAHQKTKAKKKVK